MALHQNRHQTGFVDCQTFARLDVRMRTTLMVSIIFLASVLVGVAMMQPSRADADALAWQWTSHSMSTSKDWAGVAISPDGMHIVIAEEYGGGIYTSADGGATWTNRLSAGFRNWKSVALSADGMNLAAAEYRGNIYTSTDGGVTWVRRSTAGSRDWNSIASSASGSKLVATADYLGYIYTSDDGGATWTQHTDAGTHVWNRVLMSADGSKIIASTSFSPVVLKSSDGGQTWQTRASADTTTTGGLQFISMSADGMTVAGASNGGWVYISSDGGESWRKAGLGFDHWTDISVSGDGMTILAVGTDSDRMHVSRDGGVHWTSRTSPVSQANYSSVAVSQDGSEMVMAVNHGRVYTSTDYGATWIECTVPGGNAWTSISLSRDGARIGAASSGGFLQTSADGGATWSERAGAGFGAHAFASSADGMKQAAADSGASVFTSSNGGSTWTERTGSGKRSWSALVSSADGTRLAATVAGGSVYTSGDGGATWTERVGSGTLISTIAGSADLTTLIAAPIRTSRAYLLTSSDNGATWVTRTSAGRRYWASVSSSADGSRLITADNGGYIYTSIDGGNSWTARTGPGMRDWRSVSSSADGMKYVAVSYGGPVYTSIDGGVRWIEQTELGSNGWVASAISPDATRIAVAIESGPVYTASYAGFPTEPIVSGPASTRARDEATLSFSATHAADRPIRYRVDWNGDGVVDEYVPTTGFASSAVALEASHTWPSAGTYALHVQTEDDSGALSLWSSYSMLVTSPVPTVLLTASSASYTQGGTPVTLTWSSSDATSCTGTNFSVSGTSGSRQVTPSANTTYTVSCTGAGGTAQDSKTVSYICTPSNICSGSNVVNSCTGTLVQSCQHGCTAGSCVIPPPPEPSFSVFTATDATGATFNATGHLQVRPSLVRPGASARVYWNVSDASSCTVTEDSALIADSWTGLSSGATGKTTSPLLRRTAYTLSCVGLDASTFEETQYVNLTPAWREQ